MSWIKALLLAAAVALVACHVFAYSPLVVWEIVTKNGLTGIAVGVVSAAAFLVAAILATRRGGDSRLHGVAFAVVSAPVIAAAVAAWWHGHVVVARLAAKMPTTSGRMAQATLYGVDQTLSLVGTAMFACAAAAFVLGVAAMLRSATLAEESVDLRRWRLRAGASLCIIGVAASSVVICTSGASYRSSVVLQNSDIGYLLSLLDVVALNVASPIKLATLVFALVLVLVRRPPQRRPVGAIAVAAVIAGFLATAVGLSSLESNARTIVAAGKPTSSSGVLADR